MKRHRELMLFGLSAQERSYRGLVLVALVFFGALLVAAVIAPPIYLLMSQMDNYLGNKAFSDYYDRLRWLPVLLALPWLLRKTGLTSLHAVGLVKGKNTVGVVLRWFFIGAVMAFIAAWLQAMLAPVIAENYRDGESWAQVLPGAIVGSLIAGFAIAFLEEPILRGLVFRSCYTALRPLPAMILASLFFAYVHFKIPGAVEKTLDADPNLLTGFAAAWWTLIGITQDFNLPQFLNLFALGMVLCLLYQRSETLWPCVGLHAGLVFIMLFYSKRFDVADSEWSALLGGGNLTTGWPPLLFFTTLWLLLYFTKLPKRLGG